MTYELLGNLKDNNLAEVYDTCCEGTCQLWEVKLTKYYIVLPDNTTEETTKKEWEQFKKECI